MKTKVSQKPENMLESALNKADIVGDLTIIVAM